MNALPNPGYLAATLFATATAMVVCYLAYFVKKHKELPSQENGGARKFLIVGIIALIVSTVPMFYYFSYVQSLPKDMVSEFQSGKVFYCKESIASPKLRRVCIFDGFTYDEQRGAFINSSDGTAYLLGIGGENCR